METSLSSDKAPATEAPETPARPPEVPKDELLGLARAAAVLLEETPFHDSLRTFQNVVEWDTRSDSEKVAELAEELMRHEDSKIARDDPVCALVLRTIGSLVETYRTQGRWSPVQADVGALAGFLDRLAQQRRAHPFDERRDCLSNWRFLEGRAAELCARTREDSQEWITDQTRALLEKVQSVTRYLTEWLDQSGPTTTAPEQLLDLLLWRPSLPVPKQESDPDEWRSLVEAYAAWPLCVLQTLRLLKERKVDVVVPIPMSDRFDALVHEPIGAPLVPGSDRDSERIKEVHKLGFAVAGLRQKPRVVAYKAWGSESAGASAERF